MKKTLMIMAAMLVAMALCAAHRNSGSSRTAGQNIPSGLRDSRTARRGPRTYMMRVQLADKHDTPYTLDNPSAYLSAKALERRRRQNIAVDSTDLPVAPRYVAGVESEGCRVVGRSRWNNTLLVSVADTAVAAALRSLPFVEGVRTVWQTPDSAEARRPRARWHKELVLHDTVGVSFHGAAEAQLQMAGGTRLHAQGFRGKGMTIAVMDAGFMNADVIPALRSIRLLGTADFVQPPAKSIFDQMEHGVQVLSVMAVNVPDVYVGSAPDAAYWLLRCEDELSEQPVEEDYWASAAEFADSVGVDVINSSLGFHDYDKPFGSYSYRQQDGATAMISRTASMIARKGMILVNSCGNDGMSAWKKINFPADATDILSVGAVTSERRNAGFSSLGPTADGRVKPDVMAQGSPAAVVTERGTVSSAVGTSFAAPIITGLVACLWQKYPQKTALEIMQMVRESGDNWQHPDNVYGYGVPDFGKP